MTGRQRLRRRLPRRDQRGVVAIYVAILTPVLFGLAAFAVDVSRWYVELQRLQRAADAGALAAAPFMPENLANAGNKATAAAVAEVAANGYPASAVTVTAGKRPSQVRVTVATTIDNTFARIFNMATMDLHRSAVAEFAGPAPLGSPCNTFGNEPVGGSPLSGPVGSVLGTPTLPGCSTAPKFWATIQGPNTDKVQGDQFMTRVCGTQGGGQRPDGCSGNSNDEFNADGYFFLLRVSGAAVGQTVTVQLYDPAWVVTGTLCELLIDPALGGVVNPYTNDAAARYDNDSGPFCDGDFDPDLVATPPTQPKGRVDTTFALRSPVDTLNPVAAPVVSGCVRQYRGYDKPPTADQLQEGGAAYDDELASVFHQWITLCNITNAQAGDYYLQVRTNRPVADAPGPSIVPGGPAVTSSGDDLSAIGRGSNAFAMRAFVPGNSTASRGVAVSGWERMPIFMNAASSGVATFNLIRATPGSAGAAITFIVFDVGDATSSGTVTVLPPAEADTNPTYAVGFGDFAGQKSINGCIASDPNPGAVSNCTVGISNAANNGRAQMITVPIPTGYDCDVADPGGCWFRLRVGFPAGRVNDITTWTALVYDDPVRLVE